MSMLKHLVRRANLRYRLLCTRRGWIDSLGTPQTAEQVREARREVLDHLLALEDLRVESRLKPFFSGAIDTADVDRRWRRSRRKRARTMGDGAT
jgi:hypothetical protein